VLGSWQTASVSAPTNWGFARYAVGKESAVNADAYYADVEIALSPASGTPVLFSGGTETRSINVAFYPRIHV